MSVTKFAFLPPNPAGATIHIFSFDPTLNIPCIWRLPLQTHVPSSYIAERRPQRDPTARLNF